MEHHLFKISEEKQKISFNKKIPKIQFTIETAKSEPFVAVKIILQYGKFPKISNTLFHTLLA